MNGKEIMRILDCLPAVGENSNNRYTRVYFSSLLEDLQPMDLINKKIIVEWKDSGSRAAASRLMNKMEKEGFLIPTNKPGFFYKANPEIIKSIVRYLSFSDAEANIIIKMLLNPSKEFEIKKFENNLPEHAAITAMDFIPCSPAERWRRDIEYIKNRGIMNDFNIMFMDAFDPCSEYKYKISSYFNNPFTLISNHIRQDSLPVFVRNNVFSRSMFLKIDHHITEDEEGNNSYNFSIRRNFLRSQLLLHILVYPFLKMRNYTPYKIGMNRSRLVMHLNFKDYNITRCWKTMIKFIDEQKESHFVYEFDFSEGNIEDILIKELDLIEYLNTIISEVRNAGDFILMERPYVIRIFGNKSVIIQRLSELKNHLAKIS